MVASLYLFTCTLCFTQGTNDAGAAPSLKLTRGQEIVYQGKYEEETLGEGGHSTRSFQMGSRVFVLDANFNNYEVALYTVLRWQGALNRGLEDSAPATQLAPATS